MTAPFVATTDAPTTAQGGPLSAVLAAVRGGARSLPEVARRAGLSDEMARAVVDHLVRSHRLLVRQLTSGCPSGGCGSCALAPGCAVPGGAGEHQAGAPALRQLVLAPALAG